MGFFSSEPPKAKARPRKTVSIASLGTRALDCSTCTLDSAALAHPKMPPTGAARPVVYILGEAPGRREDEDGVQFIGASGDLLRRLIPASWDQRIRWNNTIRCRPKATEGKKENREPTELETECCRRLQVHDIEQSAPLIIAGFGNAPLKWMLGQDRNITAWRGRRCPVRVGKHVAWFYPITHPSNILRASHDKKKGDAIRAAFERDVRRIFADLSEGLPEPAVESDYLAGVECLDEYGASGIARIEAALARFKDEEHAIDLETSAIRPYSPESKICTLAVGTYESVFAFPWYHPEARWTDRERAEIRGLIYGYLLGSGRKWAHSAKFEQEWLHKEFGSEILYKTEWGDTLGQAHVIDERQKMKALDDLTQLYFGFRVKSLSNVDTANIPREPLGRVLPYNGMDVKYCHALSIVQSEELQRLGLSETYEFMNSKTPSFVQMQAKGIVRNVPAIQKLHEELSHLEEGLTAKIWANKDVQAFPQRGEKFPTSFQAQAKFFRDFLKLKPERSRKSGGSGEDGDDGDGGEERGDAGKFSVDDEALEQIRHPVAKLLLEYRSATKRHGYVTPLLPGSPPVGSPREMHDKWGKFVHGDGMLHASYSQFITVTGRSSASDPSVQNFPRREHKEVRRVVGCPPGYKFVSFDYGQLEARIIAAITGDPVLGAEIHGEQDIHGTWTDSIVGKFAPAQLKENRKKARDSVKQSWTFANFYGNVVEAVAWDLSRAFKVEISPRALQPFYDEFWARYKVTREWQDDVVATYRAEGYVENAFGQKRRVPMNRNEIINHPIQGTAGLLVIDAQGRLCEIAYVNDVPILIPVLNVHDDLSFYFPESDLDECIELVAKEMVCTPFEWITIPLSVEVEVGDNWCDKEPVGKFTSKDFT